MMKFRSATIASILASAPSIITSASSRKGTKLWNHNLRHGNPPTETLSKISHPYKPAEKYERNLQDGIDGSYSVKFSHCLDVKTYDENLLDEKIVQYVQAGQIVSTKSYVLFHACQGNNCYYESEDDLYIVDLPTYLATVAVYHAEERMNYCEACDQFVNQCINNQEEDDGEGESVDEEKAEDGAGGDNGVAGEERKLSLRRRVKAIDCDECQAYGCFSEQGDADNSGNQEEMIDEKVAEWITNLSKCQPLGTQWNELDLYYGAICSAYGDGIELALFVDEDCTMHAKQDSFQNAYNTSFPEDDVNLVTYAESYIKTAFSDSMSCLEPKYEEPQQDDAVQGDDNLDGSEVNKYCKEIFEESAMNFNECNATEEEKEDADNDALSWYNFDLKMEDTETLELVCSKVKQMDGEYYHAYGESTSSTSTWYDGIKSRQSSLNEWTSLSSFTLSSTEIAGIVITSIVILFLSLFGCRCCHRTYLRSKSASWR